MADLSITPANMRLTDDRTPIAAVTAGATVTPGQPVYRDDSDSGKYKLCDADADASSVMDGLALFPAVDDGVLLIIPLPAGKDNPIEVNLGATLTQGVTYYISPNAGGICPFADLGTDDYITIVGVASSASLLQLFGRYTGAQAT